MIIWLKYSVYNKRKEDFWLIDGLIVWACLNVLGHIKTVLVLAVILWPLIVLPLWNPMQQTNDLTTHIITVNWHRANMS